MTTFVEARDNIVSFIEANFTSMPRFYENAKAVDLDAVGDRFVRVEVEFIGSHQMTIGEAPLDRTRGLVTLCLYTKEGLGARGTLQVLDTFKAAAKFQRLTKVQLETPTPGGVKCKDGWEEREFYVPFWFDSNF